MFGLLTRKQAEKEFCKIAQGFKDLKKEIVMRREIELMIENVILKNKNEIPQINSRTPRTQRRKKADKLLDKAELLSEMANLSKNGHSTQEMFNIIVEQKQLCKKTCFYKYLKKVHEEFARTPQTKTPNS